MNKTSYLTFSLNNQTYGINTAYVEEALALPELTSSKNSSTHIIGSVNLRGDILPIIDINTYLGYQTPNYSLSDSLVILKCEELRVGVIVNKTYEVKIISSDEIITEVPYKQQSSGVEPTEIISGILRQEEDILILASPANWLPRAELRQFNSSEVQDIGSVFFPNATLEERAIFRERSKDLKLLNKSQDFKNLKSLTVFSLNNNFFGIDLTWVREFTNIYQITPIPCCPPHIVGNMNLRGEILTLVDIRPLLNLPIIDISKSSKAMVVQVEESAAGLMVGDVCDVMFFLNPQAITAPDTVNKNYCDGTIPYRQGIMTILNLSKIFQNSGFIVDQVV